MSVLDFHGTGITVRNELDCNFIEVVNHTNDFVPTQNNAEFSDIHIIQFVRLFLEKTPGRKACEGHFKTSFNLLVYWQNP